MIACCATRKDGTPCTARARASGLCFAHDASLQAKRNEARHAGGLAKSNTRRMLKLTPAGLRPVLDKLFAVLDGLEDGSVEPKVGTAMASVAGVIVRVYETAEMETRLKMIEDARDEGLVV
jgi:Family of unknown function (DUF5763)